MKRNLFVIYGCILAVMVISSAIGQPANKAPSGDQVDLAVRRALEESIRQLASERHRIFYADNRHAGGTIIVRDDAFDPPTPIAPDKFKTESASVDAMVYLFTIPLTGKFAGAYEVLPSFAEIPAGGLRMECSVLTKRDTEFDVRVIIWGGQNHQFQLECLAVRR